VGGSWLVRMFVEQHETVRTPGGRGTPAVQAMPSSFNNGCGAGVARGRFPFAGGRTWPVRLGTDVGRFHANFYTR